MLRELWNRSPTGFAEMRRRSVASSLQRRSSAEVSILYALALIIGSTIGALRAQDATPPPTPVGGLQIRTVSAYAAYYSNAQPAATAVQAGATNLGSDAEIGGSAQFAWTKFSDRSSFSLIYTPSYTGRLRYSSVDSLNHTFSFTSNRKIAPRWNLGFSVTGDLSSIHQTLFTPTILSNVASVQSSFDDLASALLAAKFTNTGLAAVLTSAPLTQSPVSNLLYGERVLTSSAQTTLNYSHSPRLSLTFSVGASRNQHISDTQESIPQNGFLLPSTTSGRASLTVSYSLSPLTQIGGSVSTFRVSSLLTDTYTTTSLFTLGRTLERRWIVQIRGGMGVTNTVRQAMPFSQPATPRPVLGASLGFKTFSHTLIGTYDRTTSDSYGVGASTSFTSNATWQWRRPGGTWWLDAGLGWQQLQGNALVRTSGWHTMVGVNHGIGAHVDLRAEYAYLNYSGALQASAYTFSQNAVRISVVWNPQPPYTH